MAKQQQSQPPIPASWQQHKMAQTVAPRIKDLLDHLELPSAHIAARMDADWRDLVHSYPDQIASLSLIAPSSIQAADLLDIQSRVQIFSSDLHGFGDWAQAAVDQLPAATHHLLTNYETPVWADLTVDHGELIRQKLVAFAAAHPVPEINPQRATSGEVSGITYEVHGCGQPLLLFPLGLSPSAWNPLIDALSQDFCVIVLGGAKLGFIPFLEQRGQSVGYLSLMHTLVDWLDPWPSESILEVGCGTGVLLRWLAEETQGQNAITGVDLNRYLLTEAKNLAASHTLSNAITFQHGNAEKLPFDDNSFDKIFSITVMEEVDAAKMLRELIRVVKPGGRVGVAVRATDMAHTLNIPIPIEERAIFENLARRPEGRGAASASLYRYFHESTLTDIRFGPQFATFYDAYGRVEQYLISRVIAQLDEPDAAKWNAALQQAHEDGTFYFAWPHHMAVGKKPI